MVCKNFESEAHTRGPENVIWIYEFGIYASHDKDIPKKEPQFIEAAMFDASLSRVAASRSKLLQVSIPGARHAGAQTTALFWASKGLSKLSEPRQRRAKSFQ